MTKKVVLASLKERINILIDHSLSSSDNSDFERFYSGGYVNAMREVLVMIEDYE